MVFIDDKDPNFSLKMLQSIKLITLQEMLCKLSTLCAVHLESLYFWTAMQACRLCALCLHGSSLPSYIRTTGAGINETPNCKIKFIVGRS